MESFFSKKPVITCSDSGGSLEFVEDGINGYIAEPKPEEIGKKIDLMIQKNTSRQMGERGYDKIIKLNLSWDSVIKKLVGPLL